MHVGSSVKSGTECWTILLLCTLKLCRAICCPEICGLIVSVLRFGFSLLETGLLCLWKSSVNLLSVCVVVGGVHILDVCASGVE